MNHSEKVMLVRQDAERFLHWPLTRERIAFEKSRDWGEQRMEKLEMKEAARDLVRRSREAQGLPPKIVDPGVIDRVIRLIYLWRDPQAQDSSSQRDAPRR